ncbi:MAG: hypothetical protein IKV85_08630 [Ruminococcus sp.]|nr:hypothetical protein [Ruminococcus sp.]
MEDKTRETPVASPFTLINIVMFFVLGFTGFINLLSFNMIAFTLIIPFILANVILKVYYNKYKRNYYYKKHVNICRIIAIILTLIIFGSPLMVMFFNRTKPFYHLKQAVYSCGYRSMSKQRTRAFPDFLPRECEDYYFRIKAPAPFPEATDTYACVSFYTDEETIKKYEQEFAEKGYETINDDKTFESIMLEKNINPSELTEYFDDMTSAADIYLRGKGAPYFISMSVNDEKLLNLSHDVVVYNFRSKLGFTSGCLLDYESGIVIFWA